MFNYALSEMRYRPVSLSHRDINGTAKKVFLYFETGRTERTVQQLGRCSDWSRAGNQETAFDFPQDHVPFTLPTAPCRLCPTLPAVSHPACCPVGKGCSFPRLKRSGLEADHMSLSGAEIKNDWMCTSIFPYVQTRL
jgi:hypothetical protein